MDAWNCTKIANGLKGVYFWSFKQFAHLDKCIEQWSPIFIIKCIYIHSFWNQILLDFKGSVSPRSVDVDSVVQGIPQFIIREVAIRPFLNQIGNVLDLLLLHPVDQRSLVVFIANVDIPMML